MQHQLFFSSAARPYTSYVLRSAIRSMRRYELQISTAQKIRSSVITHWLEQYSLGLVLYIAGHRYILATESYQKYEVKALNEQIKLYHSLG